MPMDADLHALGDEKFISLTTFRRSGEAVSTPVWVARDGDALLVTTPAGSGKVKRLRNDSRVELRPSSRRGTVPDGQGPVTAAAAILPDDDRARGVIRKKYGLEYRVVMTIERFLSRGQRNRVTLRITGD